MVRRSLARRFSFHFEPTASKSANERIRAGSSVNLPPWRGRSLDRPTKRLRHAIPVSQAIIVEATLPKHVREKR